MIYISPWAGMGILEEQKQCKKVSVLGNVLNSYLFRRTRKTSNILDSE